MCLGFYLAAVGALCGVLLQLTDGHLVYTLDDPYIHLALSQSIAHGHYGINMGRFSSPSSSILWPFLLALGARLRWHELLPFAFNVLFASAAALFLGSFIDRWAWWQEGASQKWKRPLLCLTLILATNLIGLTFVGMEHSLQVLLTLGCAYGILEAFADRDIPAWCMVCAVAGTAVRYENLGIALALALVLVVQKRYSAAAWTFGLSLLVLGAFALFLLAHGQHAVPNSVMSKAQAPGTQVAARLDLWRIVRQGLHTAALVKRYDLLLVVLAGLALKERGRRSAIMMIVVSTLLLHLLFGRFGWQARYEVYAVTLGAVLLLSALTNFRYRWSAAVTVLILLAIPYIDAATRAPLEALTIYTTEYQVSRFFHDCYRHDIAVDDLGLASFKRAPGVYVFDLDGLGSNESLALGIGNYQALERAVHRRHIGVATLWPDNPGVPSEWHRVGTINAVHNMGTAAQDRAFLYSTEDGNPEQLRTELREFAHMLPNGSTLRLWKETADGHPRADAPMPFHSRTTAHRCYGD